MYFLVWTDKYKNKFGIHEILIVKLTQLSMKNLLIFHFQRLYMCSSRQIKRIESNTRSPIYSFFGETISGTTTIRAFSMQTRFISSIEAKVDDNIKYSYSLINANRWGRLVNISEAMSFVVWRIHRQQFTVYKQWDVFGLIIKS